MAKRAKVDISDSVFEQALAMREAGKPKTEQCKVLGIAYNTTRLELLLSDYVSSRDKFKQLREKKKNEPVTPSEVSRWATEYVLENRSISDIADSSYRTTGIVRYYLEKVGAMFVRRGVDKLESAMIPEQAMAEDFSIGQLVWVAPYGCMGEIRGKIKEAYKVYVFGEGVQEFTFQPSHELGNLAYLEALGVNLKTAYNSCLSGEQCALLIQEALEKLYKSNKKGN